jgi:hypothetical protein
MQAWEVFIPGQSVQYLEAEKFQTSSGEGKFAYFIDASDKPIAVVAVTPGLFVVKART